MAWLRAAPGDFADLTLLDIGPGPLRRDGSASWRVLSAVRGAPAEAPDRRSLRAFLIDAGLSAGTADWALMNVVCEAQGCRWRIDREALAALHARVNDDDLWDVVEQAQVPLRCIRGGASSYVSDADAARLVSLGCEVETVPGAGHDVHADAADEVAARFG